MKVNSENYFSPEANWHYMSVSQYKSFLECEAAAMARLKGEYDQEEKDCFVEGKYLHAWNEGTLDNFIDEHPELYSSKGATKGQLKAQYQKLNELIPMLENDKLVMMALEGQKEVILTAELFGIPWKIMIDSYNPDKGRFADLKVVKSLTDKFWNNDNGCYENFIEHYGYTKQIAVYSEVEKLASGRGEYLEGLIVAATKERIPDKAIINFDTDMIEFELAMIEARLPRIIDVKAGNIEPEGCGKCDYCKSKKQLTGIIHYKDLLTI